MANQEHLDLIKRDTKAWNEWRGPFVQPDLSGADLSGEDLGGTNLISVNLSKAILCGTDLSNSYLDNADLSEAHLEEANLSQSTLVGVNLNGAHLNDAELSMTNFSLANLRGANLSGADLSGANLNDADLRGATLSGCTIYGISAWNVLLDGAIQSGLIITQQGEPTLKVDNLEVAQFIYLLLRNEKLRDVLNAVMEKGVLLLGRFDDGGLATLQAIAARLRDISYLPIIFDFDRPDSRNLTETVMTLVGLSRFVIVDLSGRSVANELRSTIPHFKIPFVPIIEESRKQEIYSMFSDFLEDDWVLPLVVFTERNHLMELLPSKIIEPAEKRCDERQTRLKEIFKR